MAKHLARAYRATLTPTPTAAPSIDDETLITSTTACALAGGVTLMTLWRWARDGMIPAPLKIRGRNYWKRTAFLAALQVAGTAAEVAQ